MAVKPITPTQAKAGAINNIPDFVIEAFNHLIQQNLYNGYSTVLQDDVVDYITARNDVTRDELFKKHWLDVEDIFRSAGWTVEYDKPAYCETYPASFKFKIKGI